MTNMRRRLAKLEEELTPSGGPIVIDVVFVDATTKLRRTGFQITIGGCARDRRRTTA
jgi:hypothetical protein